MSGKPGRSGRKIGGPTSSAPPGHIPEQHAAVITNRFARGMTLADSMLAAGYPCDDPTDKNERNRLSSRAGRIIERHANSELLEALQQNGVDHDTVAKAVAEGLTATTFVKTGRDESMEVPDHSARHKFVETFLGCTGAKAPKKVEIENMTFEQRLMLVIQQEEDGKLITE